MASEVGVGGHRQKDGGRAALAGINQAEVRITARSEIPRGLKMVRTGGDEARDFFSILSGDA